MKNIEIKFSDNHIHWKTRLEITVPDKTDFLLKEIFTRDQGGLLPEGPIQKKDILNLDSLWIALHGLIEGKGVY